MINLHLISTEKYSPLAYSTNGGGHLFKSEHYSPMKEMGDSYKNIYITSNEEIKEGDCFYDSDGELCKYTSDYTVDPNTWEDNKKIILTTDQDLIKNGVQSIDEDFLKWFVKNSSCEKVEVKKGKMKLNDDGEEYGFPDMSLYKIIIPKEEPKQETHICKHCGVETTQSDDECYAKPLEEREPYWDLIDKKAEQNNRIDIDAYANGVQDGAKYMAERMYSEEDMIDFAEWRDKYIDMLLINKNTTKELLHIWFKQFKKKIT